MFAYCANNPCRYSDPSGNAFIEALVIAVGAEYAATIIIGSIVIVCGAMFATIESLVNWLSDLFYEPSFEVIYADDTLNTAQVVEAEHTKNKSEKNRNKHEEGNARRQRDQGGEKKKQRKGWIINPNKRKWQNVEKLYE